ncbi:cytochrome c [Bradyrhizobium sp. Rc2d]|uniref:c-type cytochrome n=1 Tax=Bradyrhizobium sp. Rc2d TaxID=1855321 RepID=UPI00088C6E2B|nr:cytochrome c [Bradyrhizobium sp. Rc2d]SDJ54021.1 cytochrome c [Bradyrhizobium sp. Rc2d]
MFTRDACIGAASLCVAVLPLTVGALAQDTTRFSFGVPATQQELAKFYAIPPDGRGLPPGSGDATMGAKIYAQNCASCHGDHLEGNPAKGVGGDKLTGGRGTLATKTPSKTVESYWPYATTLFDYVKRAMPFNAPGSLSDDDVYGVVAYILAQATIIKPTETMNAATLPKVAMPNRDGFEPDPRPEMQLYR